MVYMMVYFWNAFGSTGKAFAIRFVEDATAKMNAATYVCLPHLFQPVVSQ